MAMRIEQITKVLEQNSYSTVHIVSHGSPGCLYLGNTQLSLDTLTKYQNELKQWFSSFLVPRSSLLIYGCNVAAGDAGEEFIAKLHDLTDAEIAASTTRTGNAAKGGNWELNINTGSNKPQLAFTEDLQHSYIGVFANIFTDNFDGNTTGGTGSWTVNPNGTDTATGDLTGQWAIGDPVPHDRGTIAPAQIEANSLLNALITGLTATNTNTDVDGFTTIHSPNFTLPSSNFNSIDVSWNYYHAVTGGATDPLRVDLVRTSDNTVLSTLFNQDPASVQTAVWTPFSASLDSFAGETTYLRFTATDGGTASILEAGIDDVSVTYTTELSLDPDGSSGASLGNYAISSLDGASVNIADSDAAWGRANNVNTLTLDISGLEDGADEILTIGGTDFPLNADTTTTATVGGTTFNVAITNDGTTFTLTNNAGGSIPTADVNTLLTDITYRNDATNITSNPRTINVTATDTNSDSETVTSTIATVSPGDGTPINGGNGAIYSAHGNNNIYSIDVTTGKATILTTSPFALVINSLASDVDTGLVYYT